MGSFFNSPTRVLPHKRVIDHQRNLNKPWLHFLFLRVLQPLFWINVSSEDEADKADKADKTGGTEMHEMRPMS